MNIVVVAIEAAMLEDSMMSHENPLHVLSGAVPGRLLRSGKMLRSHASPEKVPGGGGGADLHFILHGQSCVIITIYGRGILMYIMTNFSADKPPPQKKKVTGQSMGGGGEPPPCDEPPPPPLPRCCSWYGMPF